MSITKEQVVQYAFDCGNSYKSTIGLDVTLLTKTKSEADFDENSWIDPFDYATKEDYFREVCDIHHVSSIDSIDFKLTDTDIEESLHGLFFDEDDKPKDALFDFGELTAHTQEVVNSYACCFDIDDDITLLELLDKISECYAGKYDSLADYAEMEVDNYGFGIEVPDSLKQYIDFEEMGEDMEGDLFIEEDHYFRKV